MNKNSKFILLILIVIVLITSILVYFKTNSYHVNFYSEGKLYQSIKVRKNRPMSEPEMPTREGYIFIGWYNENGESWNFEDKVTEDLALTAGWGQVTTEED